MKMKFIISISLFILISSSITAQSASPDVIGSAGDHFASASGSISWTIGEPVSDTYLGSSYIITKGFHQPAIFPQVSVVEHENDINMLVYPNPVSDELMISFKGMKQGNYNIDLFDAAGRMLLHSEENIKLDHFQKSIVMDGFSGGLYVVKIVCFDNNVNRFYRITKQ